MAKPAKKQTDHFMAYTVGLALTIVLIGFVAAWFYFRHGSVSESPVAYATIGPLVIQSPQYSIRATVAVQAAQGQAAWLENNKQSLQFALQAALADVNQQRVRQPDGLAYLSKTLKQRVDDALHTDKVQDILLTDFIIQSND